MTDEILIDGIEKALDNANSLHEEASILEKHKKHERAYLLYHICIEEIGKAHLLFYLLLDEEYKDDKKLKKFLKDFRDHPTKISASIGVDTIIARLIENKEDRHKYIETIAKQYENVSKINDLKNFSLYTNYFSGQFVRPSYIIDEKLLGNIKFYAETRLLASAQILFPLIKTLDTFRPMYQKEKAELTPDKMTEMTQNLFNGT
jgi:AbiV family abortive infection protein